MSDLTPADTALKLWMRFDRNGLGYDSDTKTTPFTLVNAPTRVRRTKTVTTVAAEHGGYPHFGMDLVRASEQGLSAATLADLNVGSQNFTISAWFRTDELNADHANDKTVIAKWDVNGNAKQFRLYLDGADDHPKFGWRFSGADHVLDFGSAATKTEFVHAVVTWHNTDGDAVAYLNGVQVDIDSTNVGTITTTAAPVTLGFSMNNTTKQLFWDGVLGEILFFHRALLAEEVAWLHRFGFVSSRNAGQSLSSYQATDAGSRAQPTHGDLLL